MRQIIEYLAVFVPLLLLGWMFVKQVHWLHQRRYATIAYAMALWMGFTVSWSWFWAAITLEFFTNG